MISFQPRGVDSAPMSSATERLNAVLVNGLELQAALERLESLPARSRGDPRAQALALQAFVEEEMDGNIFASAALHARATALTKWTAAHDPQRQSNAKSVIDAAARFPLNEGAAGIEFEAAGFQEMILFIEELPW